MVLSGNTAQSDGDPNANPYNPNSLSGRTWRFLVENYAGYNNQILNNTSIDLGPRDSDVNYGPSGQNELVGANSSENVLTESFSVHFEGLPLAVSDGGLILQIPQPQNGAANTGDVVSDPLRAVRRAMVHGRPADQSDDVPDAEATPLGQIQDLDLERRVRESDLPG